MTLMYAISGHMLWWSFQSTPLQYTGATSLSIVTHNANTQSIVYSKQYQYTLTVYCWQLLYYTIPSQGERWLRILQLESNQTARWFSSFSNSRWVHLNRPHLGTSLGDQPDKGHCLSQPGGNLQGGSLVQVWVWWIHLLSLLWGLVQVHNGAK